MSNGLRIFFMVMWSGVTLLFDAWAAHGIYKQCETIHYPSVAGTVKHSEVRQHRNSKGAISYSAEVSYAYTVGADRFFGDKLRFAPGFSSGWSQAAAIVNEYPAGASVSVYYNPTQPVEAVLSPGIEGSDFVMVLFLTPFNAIMLGFWIWFGAWLRERLYRPAAGGMRVITDGVCTRVRLPRWSACWWGLGTSGGLGFVLTFIIGFATQMRPSLSLVFFAIAAVCGAGLVVYLWQRSNINSGVDDLIINAPAQTLQLPLTFGRRETVTVNLPDIEFVWVEKVVHRSSKGGISYTYAPTLALRGVAPGSQKLADWSDKLKADDFAQWLAPQLGVPLNSEQAPAL